MILDSGTRREFDTGAVRDIQEGKGRCDLLPLDVVAFVYKDPVIADLYAFTEQGEVSWLYQALEHIMPKFGCYSKMFLEVAIHFEEGCKKYGPDNWKKGIPTRCYLDSAVRHLLKWIRNDEDEPHDRAFVWNIMCCIWTCTHKPELNDYAKEGESNANI
jgi:hypothetical protein